MMAVLFTIGCEKESFTEAEQFDQMELKKATVKVPMKCWFTTVPDYSLEMIACSPVKMGVEVLSGGFIKGHQTHGGKINMELSPWKVIECEFDPGLGVMTGYIRGRNTLANGDYYFYTGVMHIAVANGMLTGKISMNGGVGKFKKVTGDLLLTGKSDFNEATFTAEGFCTFQ